MERGKCKVISALDSSTRCKHYHQPLDIIAIKFKCCNTYYPCYQCHQEHADHEAEVWPMREWNTTAILCGACHHEWTIQEYLDCQYTCPGCKASFNPGCGNHRNLYFEA
ncbi:CHY zinc finger protein [Paenibacillus sp. 1001270B_150601_E10]|uniref:CHY zinc finger protein n=1 Tax=Paenibacillus sp. 1001270B_150601_E10 TaxID=2787079 RepID=UPI00189EED6B|nr:CHY zinc finger protein [Paenibacillus sp. 1001270B_150601_E10]